MIRKIYDWMGSQVHSKHADLALGILFYLEAIFFIPVDPILIIYCLEHRQKALYYATIATITSVLGGITGYFIGVTLWNLAGPEIINFKVVSWVMTPATFEYLKEQYHLYANWAVFAAGFTPIPYKAATLSAGFCRLPLFPFIITSLIARGARFFLYAVILKTWGVQIKQYIDRYFNILVICLIIIVSFIIWFAK